MGTDPGSGAGQGILTGTQMKLGCWWPGQERCCPPQASETHIAYRTALHPDSNKPTRQHCAHLFCTSVVTSVVPGEAPGGLNAGVPASPHARRRRRHATYSAASATNSAAPSTAPTVAPATTGAGVPERPPEGAETGEGSTPGV